MASPTTQAPTPEAQGYPVSSLDVYSFTESRLRATLAPRPGSRRPALRFFTVTHPLGHLPFPALHPASQSARLTPCSSLGTDGLPEPAVAPLMHFSLCSQSGCSEISWSHPSCAQRPTDYLIPAACFPVAFRAPRSRTPDGVLSVTPCKPPCLLLASAGAVTTTQTSVTG